MSIGIIGMGKMGNAVAQRLRETGNEVRVWNRTPGKAGAALAAGATEASSPAALVDSAEVILSLLTDATAIQAVLDRPDGPLSGPVAGKLFIEMSTVRPETQRAAATRVRGAGGAYVECAVSGTTGPARQGRLVGLAGGEEADVARARPVLDQLCRRVEHVGPIGAGASMKLAVNLPLAVYFQALGEAYALCRHLGRDPAWIIDLMSDTSGGANVLKARGPVFAAALAGNIDQTPGFDVDSIRKDLRTMIAEARALGYELPVAQRVLDVYDEASRDGWGERDGTALAAFWSHRHGAG